MRSIPQAMIWEMWRHGRWILLLGVLGANLLPASMLAALRLDGAVDPRDPSLIIMHVVLVQINMFTFAAAIFTAQGSPSRLNALPATSATIVVWHLLPIMALMALESAVSTVALNAMFDLGWPVWGPALFAAVATAAVAAMFWLTDKSGWVFVGLMIVPAAMGIWFKSRYGEQFSTPTRLWSEVSFAEAVTMLAVTLLAYLAAVAGVSRNRRGEPLPSIGLIAWLGRLLDPAPYAGLPFRSPVQAQSWFEWRKKGLAMPAAVVFGLVLVLGIWLIANRNVHDLFHAFLVGGGLLSVVAMIGGMIMGNCGANDADFAIGSFQASRPLTNSEMARIILKTAAKSVTLAWAIWLSAFLGLYLTLLAMPSLPQPLLPRELGWWYFPAVLIGAWTVVGLLTSAGLTGRSAQFVILLCGLFALWIALTVFARFALSRSAQEQLWQVALVVGGIAFVLATAWALIAARRRKLVAWATIYVAASVWAALCALITVADVCHASQRLPLYTVLVGISALAVAPLATAPLALAWNRNR